MSEISRDKLEINSIKANNNSFKGKKQEKCKPCTSEAENICSDCLKNHPGEVIGRSQVKFNKLSFNGELAENLKKDLDFYSKNAAIVKKSETLHNIAYEKAIRNGNPDPYKIATQAQMGYIQEMNKE